MEVAQYGIPMLIEEDTVAGATTPFTIAGTLVEQNTNILCAVALAQMVNPGAPCVYSISLGIMDMEAGNYSAAVSESTLLHIATSQMAHFYNLSFQGGNTCDSELPDAQMGYERALHFSTRAQTLKYLRKTRWMPKLTDRRNWEAWKAHGSKDMKERVREAQKEVLERDK